jgi:outer membrane protein assembly factor BamD (BamD/ComL family)
LNITEVSFGNHDKAIAALEELKRNLSISLEYQQVMAKLIRARYDGLRKEGFTEAQAIEIVKEMYK